MLQLSTINYNRDILSLRTSAVIGRIERPIINPDNLKIEGWYARNLQREQLVLPPVEVRDFISKGVVVNDHDALTKPDDMVRIKDLIAFGFELLGKPVFSEKKRRIGKVQDYATDSDTLYIQKLYINQSLLRGFSTEQLIIDRQDIVEITPKKIIIKDILKTAPASGERATSPAPAV